MHDVHASYDTSKDSNSLMMIVTVIVTVDCNRKEKLKSSIGLLIHLCII